MQDKKDKRTNIPIENEISKEAYPLVEAFMSHLREISIIVGAIVLIAVFYSGYKIYKQKRLSNAKKEFKSILMQKDRKQEITKLNLFLTKAPEGIKDAIRFELITLYLKDKNYKNAQRIWEDIYKDTEDADIKFISRLGLAESLAMQQKYNHAIKILDSLKTQKEYNETIFTEIAKIAEAAKDYKQAIWAYKELTSISQDRDPNYMYYKYKIAQLEAKL